MADDDLRRLALARVESQLDRLRAAGPAAVADLAALPPQDAQAEEGLTVTTHVNAEGNGICPTQRRSVSSTPRASA